MDARDLTLKFVDFINSQNVAGICSLLSGDHRFIDAEGKSHGRDVMQAGWEQYFSCFPDYRIEVDAAVQQGDTVAIFGWASGCFRGSSHSWRIPSAWKAIVRDDQVVEWRVYADVEPMMRSMGIRRFES